MYSVGHLPSVNVSFETSRPDVVELVPHETRAPFYETLRNDARIMYAECTVAHLTFISIAMLAAMVFLFKSIC